MGTARQKPARLAAKLSGIRVTLGLSQNDLIRRLHLPNDLTQARISAYERGVREPPLAVLLAYARLAGVYVDVLIDDQLNLPPDLPAKPTSGGIKKSQRSVRTAKR